MYTNMKEFFLHVFKPQLLIPDIIMFYGMIMTPVFFSMGAYDIALLSITPLLLKIIWSVFMVVFKRRQVSQWLPGDWVLYVCDDGEWVLWVNEYEYVKTTDRGQVMLKHLKHQDTYLIHSLHDAGGKLKVVSLSEISLNRTDNRYFNQSRLDRMYEEKQNELRNIEKEK